MFWHFPLSSELGVHLASTQLNATSFPASTLCLEALFVIRFYLSPRLSTCKQEGCRQKSIQLVSSAVIFMATIE